MFRSVGPPPPMPLPYGHFWQDYQGAAIEQHFYAPKAHVPFATPRPVQHPGSLLRLDRKARGPDRVLHVAAHRLQQLHARLESAAGHRAGSDSRRDCAAEAAGSQFAAAPTTNFRSGIISFPRPLVVPSPLPQPIVPLVTPEPRPIHSLPTTLALSIRRPLF